MWNSLVSTFSKDLGEFASATTKLVSGGGAGDGHCFGDEDIISEEEAAAPRTPLVKVQSDDQTYAPFRDPADETEFESWCGDVKATEPYLDKDRWETLIKHSSVVKAKHDAFMQKLHADEGVNVDREELTFFLRYFFNIRKARQALGAEGRAEKAAEAQRKRSTPTSAPTASTSHSQAKPAIEDPWKEDEDNSAAEVTMELEHKCAQLQRTVEVLSSEVRRLTKENEELHRQLAQRPAIASAAGSSPHSSWNDVSDQGDVNSPKQSPTTAQPAASAAATAAAPVAGGDDDDYANWADETE